MQTELTRQLTEVTDTTAANKLIECGWTLLDSFVRGYGDPTERRETMHYVLAWQQDDEPKFPPKSTGW